METYFADLHIHIGAASNGQPVKITASRKLNLENILQEAAGRKGLNIVGIIDAASPAVINDLQLLLEKGEMRELSAGGLLYREQLLVILGSEVESREDNGGQTHYLAYFPFFKQIKAFSELMKGYIRNINLSSQVSGLNGRKLLHLVHNTGGIFIPAHAFTPHKSFYGRSFTTYRQLFTEEEWQLIPAIELGLSADTYLADYLPELQTKTFLSNSDAHSLGKIAREYNQIKMDRLSFEELELALRGVQGRGIKTNYGLDPRLGKYHRSYCPDCKENFNLAEVVLKCPRCGSEKLVVGVKDRILSISPEKLSVSPAQRPPYVHQIPLAEIPGIGPKTLEKLFLSFGSEMNILHHIAVEELEQVVGSKIAAKIEQARQGRIAIAAGGGGIYGKVMG